MLVECDPVRSWLSEHVRRDAQGCSFTFDDVRAGLRFAKLRVVSKADLADKLEAELPGLALKWGSGVFDIRYDNMSLE